MLKFIKQNRHVMTVALALFIVSMSTLSFFMRSNSEFQKDFKADIIHSTKDESYEEKEKKYREYLQNEKDPFVILDKETKIVFASKNFEENFGFGKEELKNEVFPALLKDKDISIFLGAFSKIIQQHKPLTMIGPYSIYNKHEEPHLSVSSMVIIEGEEEVTNIAIIIKEIVEIAPSEKNAPEEDKVFPKGKKILHETDKEEHLIANKSA